MTDLDIAKRLVRTEHSANSRSIEFNMTFKKMKELLTAKKCFFTGNLLTREDPKDPNYLTLDRVDASAGYTDDNVVACGNAFNQKKGDLTVEDIKLLFKGLRKKDLI